MLSNFSHACTFGQMGIFEEIYSVLCFIKNGVIRSLIVGMIYTLSFYFLNTLCFTCDMGLSPWANFLTYQSIHFLSWACEPLSWCVNLSASSVAHPLTPYLEEPRFFVLRAFIPGGALGYLVSVILKCRLNSPWGSSCESWWRLWPNLSSMDFLSHSTKLSTTLS